MKNQFCVIVAVLIALFLGECFAESLVVELSDVPADGFVVCPLDMTPAANWLTVERWDGAEFLYGDRKIDAVFVPGDTPLNGTFVAVLPDDVPRGKTLRLRFNNKAGDKVDAESPIVVGSLVFDAEKFGGLPSSIAFANGKTLETRKWGDRLHSPQIGLWDLSKDKNATVDLVVDKPFLKVVRTAAAFRQGDDAPPSNPKTEYQWFVFPQRELVYVAVFAQQEEPTEWKSKHFLELHIPDGSFGKWFGGDTWFGSDKLGDFTGSKQSISFARYCGILDESNNVIAAISPKATLYDGADDVGSYLLPKSGDAWQPWSGTKHRLTTWYWIGNTAEPVKTLQSVYDAVTKMPQAKIVIPELAASAKDWKSTALNDLFFAGRISSKNELERLRNADKLPENWIDVETDDLGMILEITDNKEKGKGMRLLSLVDIKTKTVLSARESAPLFTAEVLDKTTGKIVSIDSDAGWKSVVADGRTGTFEFAESHLPDGQELRVALRIEEHPGISWNWRVVRCAERYEFRKLTCPQITVRNFGPTMKAFYPYASGIVMENPVGKELRWRWTYPNGWCPVQWTAAYDETKNTGLYVATHDSGGAVKDIRLDADSATDSLTIRFEHPLPLLDNPESIEVGGCVWRVFHGDWYDAAVIYRDFVREFAEWYPRQNLGPDGRTDTPQWMKELCVWAQCWDSPQQMPQTMRKFTDALGVPTAVHWYSWHQIPFDNDYPHFFPPKDGFKEAVAEIQKNGDCYVMPYINGNFWDRRDKELEDFQFLSIAQPAAVKREDGTLYIKTFSKEESDGSKVEFVAMCPATDLWKDKVAELTLRLMNEYGVASVYLDCVAAAKPELCFDKSHGHPLAGGDWWTREFRKMFDKIRNEMPKDRMLTSECNADPFTNIFDGFLTWHFQYPDQVPAFSAVYGGAIQMFGRAYSNRGPSYALASRMKLAEQLVYGEQIGWLNPQVIDDEKRFPFFKEIVQTRYKYRDYFYKGEMIRPPKLLDEVPTVTADWQYRTEVIITMDAVRTGAWRKTDENGDTVSAIFFFVNVSDEPVTSRVAVRLDEIGLESNSFDNPINFEPGVPLAIEVLR